MKSVSRPVAPSSGNLHEDGAIRCPWSFHSVLPDENDRVEVRARAAVRGDHLLQVPLDAVSRAFQAALTAAGVGFTDAEALVYPPEHDCAALTEAAETGDTPPKLWLFRMRDWSYVRCLEFPSVAERDQFITGYSAIAAKLGGDGFFLADNPGGPPRPVVPLRVEGLAVQNTDAQSWRHPR